MNILPSEKRRQILDLMVKGNSVRAIARLVEASPATVLRLLQLAGTVCADFHQANVRAVKAKRVQCHETWSFSLARDKAAKPGTRPLGDAGNIWTWTAQDCESKLIVSYMCGGRDPVTAYEFLHDVASRLATGTRLITDGRALYLEAKEGVTGLDVDCATLVEAYGAGASTFGQPMKGCPDLPRVGTSYVERNKRLYEFTRFANHVHMVALYTVWYNFGRINPAVRVSPAIAAGISDHCWGLSDIVGLVSGDEIKL